MLVKHVRLLSKKIDGNLLETVNEMVFWLVTFSDFVSTCMHLVVTCQNDSSIAAFFDFIDPLPMLKAPPQNARLPFLPFLFVHTKNPKWRTGWAHVSVLPIVLSNASTLLDIVCYLFTL